VRVYQLILVAAGLTALASGSRYLADFVHEPISLVLVFLAFAAGASTMECGYRPNSVADSLQPGEQPGDLSTRARLSETAD
jgi:hypothetical protein